MTLPAGTYSASTSRSGFLAQSKSDTVHAGFATDLNFYLTASSTAPCTLKSTVPSVTICTPANNATLTSPVHVVAGTRDSVGVSFIQAYVDGVAKVTQTGGKLDASVAMSAGTHRLTVQAKDTSGVFFRQTIFITVK
jgi:Bacterial Ig domain